MKVILNLEGRERDLGSLAWSTEEHRAYFEYSADFLAAPLPISPFRLRVKTGFTAAELEPFEGLHGMFNDSLPDGWGRILVDRRVTRSGADLRDLTPLDRLSVVGKSGMGALAYIPEHPEEGRGEDDLDWFVEQVERVQNEMETAEIDALQGAQGGSAGARPKIMIGLNSERNAFAVDYGQPLRPGLEHWIVKARSMRDRSDIGVEEHAYALMARAAGLEMSDTCVLRTGKGNELFATKRFDRIDGGRIHMHTVSGLVNADHRSASLDYGDLHRITAALTRDSAEVLRVFAHMTFNLYAHNRDDHPKNHSFLMGADGRWRLSPAYDLTFSFGPGGEHSLAIGGEGRRPGREHLLKEARSASISEREANEVIERVRSAVDQWPAFASVAGLKKARTDEIDRILNGVRPSPVLARKPDDPTARPTKR
jgi:serine/threonine-protein kinase HipA